MKMLIVVLCLFFTGAPTTLVIVDKNLKKPLRTAAEFSTEDYMQHNFPIYAAEKEALIAASDQAARWIEQTENCYSTDSIQTPHTLVVVDTHCDAGRAFSVRLFTNLTETATTYSFQLVKLEPNKRKAQQKLMEFATYINQ